MEIKLHYIKNPKKLKYILILSMSILLICVILIAVLTTLSPDKNIVAAETLPKLGLGDGEVLKKGMEGNKVSILQTILKSKGYLNDVIDGEFGPNTENAVRAFQAVANLPVNGIVDKANADILNSEDSPVNPDELYIKPNIDGEKLVHQAMEMMGAPYIYADEGPYSFDCSGYNQFIFKKFGLKLNRTAKTQGYDERYKRLSIDQLTLGDLVFFNTVSDNDLSDHSGIYIGNGYFIHASSSITSGPYVRWSSLDSGYYNRVFSWGLDVSD